MQIYHFLAFDLGASSGRAILGTYDQNQIQLRPLHRFDNQMIYKNGHYHWDVHSLFDEILKGLRKCVNEENIIPHCIGIDTWGVDFGLLHHTGEVAGLPFAYRDHLTDDAIEQVLEKISAEELYKTSGIQFMKFNSLFQLWSLKKFYPEKILSADKLLFMPDLLSFLLSGSSYSEYTIASTSQMLIPGTGQWNMNLLHQLGLPTHLLEELVWPGTVIGNIKPELQAELGTGPVPVAAVAAHDTASAVAAIPAKEGNWAFLSSGTWSLLGMQLEKPCLSPKAFELAFTNEGGIDGSTRFLKNITGLWIIQESKKIWDKSVNHSFAELVQMSKKATPFQSYIDPDHPSFMNPSHMVDAIQSYLQRSNQPVLKDIPSICRCIFESLAMKYQQTLKQLIEITGEKIDHIHLIGGGAQNQVLCQYTANATGLPIIAGPAEATALGNILLQAKAIGLMESQEQMQKVAANSVTTKTYSPKKIKEWAKEYGRYTQIISNFE